ncbi:hypothetical protein VPH1266_0074 [Vibrio phage 1266]
MNQTTLPGRNRACLAVWREMVNNVCDLFVLSIVGGCLDAVTSVAQ